MINQTCAMDTSDVCERSAEAVSFWTIYNGSRMVGKGTGFSQEKLFACRFNSRSLSNTRSCQVQCKWEQQSSTYRPDLVKYVYLFGVDSCSAYQFNASFLMQEGICGPTQYPWNLSMFPNSSSSLAPTCKIECKPCDQWSAASLQNAGTRPSWVRCWSKESPLK